MRYISGAYDTITTAAYFEALGFIGYVPIYSFAADTQIWLRFTPTVYTVTLEVDGFIGKRWRWNCCAILAASHRTQRF